MAIPRPHRRDSTGTGIGYQHVLHVFSRSRTATRGWIRAGPLLLPCALGRGGRSCTKREGDGATPSGTWRVKQVLYRRDRLMRPRSGLPTRPLRPDDGWCDAVGNRNYNRHVRHPYPASAERLWRSDGVYDVIVVLDHNTRPRVQRAGSAIFIHLARRRFPADGGLHRALPPRPAAAALAARTAHAAVDRLSWCPLSAHSPNCDHHTKGRGVNADTGGAIGRVPRGQAPRGAVPFVARQWRLAGVFES